jgi:hypothetical protein
MKKKPTNKKETRPSFEHITHGSGLEFASKVLENFSYEESKNRLEALFKVDATAENFLRNLYALSFFGSDQVQNQASIRCAADELIRDFCFFKNAFKQLDVGPLDIQIKEIRRATKKEAAKKR